MVAEIALVLGAYVVGTFPSAQLVAAGTGHDPTREGSGNPGASNVYRVAGRRAGVTVGLADAAKGALPTLVALVLFGRETAVACWVAAVLGHVFPLPRGLRGGKGVATGAGGALVLHPIIGVALGALFVAVVKIGRRASLGSLTIAIAYPVLIAVAGAPWWETAAAVGVSAVVVIRHRANIARLVARAEPTVH